MKQLIIVQIITNKLILEGSDMLSSYEHGELMKLKQEELERKYRHGSILRTKRAKKDKKN